MKKLVCLLAAVLFLFTACAPVAPTPFPTLVTEPPAEILDPGSLPALGPIWYVATTGDDQANTCQTIDSPCRTVQWVIDQASDGDMVRIAEGVYAGRIVIGDLDIHLSGAGAGTILQPAANAGWEVEGGVISIACPGCAGSVGISNLTVQNGRAIHGGGIAVEGVELTLEDVTIRDSSASSSGGCITVGDADVLLTRVTLEGCTIPASVENGSFTHGRGGGIANFGRLEMVDSILRGNSSSENGGGLYNDTDASAALAGILVEGNIAAEDGGGIYNRGKLSLTTGTLRVNTALNGKGSPIHAEPAVGIDDDDGGAVYNSGRADIRAVTINDNQADHAALDNDYGRMILMNVTISGNGPGWGVMTGSDQLFYAGSVTIAGNQAGGINAIWGNDKVHLVNTLLAVNNPDCSSYGPMSGYNNFSSDETCAFFTVDPQGQNNRSNLDLLLDGLADNGGPAWTHALAPESPAVDAIAEGAQVCLQTDQRGVQRPVDGNGDGTARCDIGAFELDPYATELIRPENFLLAAEPMPALFSPQGAGDCRAGPADAQPVLVTLPEGTAVLADGRTQAGDWYRAWTADGMRCWLPASPGTLDGDALLLPVIEDLPVLAVTPSATPVPGSSSGITFSSLVSSAEFQYQRDCVPNPDKVTIIAQLSSTTDVKFVYIFFHLKSSVLGVTTAWNQGAAMTRGTDGMYSAVVSWRDIPELSKISGSSATFLYQFVAVDAAGGVIARSQIFSDVTISPCH